MSSPHCSLPRDEVGSYVMTTRIGDTSTHHMCGEFLTASKSIITPREKDFKDVLLIDSMGIDDALLVRTYQKAPLIADASPLAVPTLRELISMADDDYGAAQLLFQCFPGLVNTLATVRPYERRGALTVTRDYVVTDRKKDGYQKGTVVGNAARLIRLVPQDERLHLLSRFFYFCLGRDYRDVDSITHNEFTPQLEADKKTGTERVLVELEK